MSKEFLKIATKEINDEIAKIKKLLDFCENDSDIGSKSKLIEKHMHKIKGLAPMMKKKHIGEIAMLNDSLLKHVMEGKQLDGILSILVESNIFMTKSMQNLETNPTKIKQKITTQYAKFLD